MARLICIALLLTLAAFLPGCGGCRSTPPKTPEELEKEELARKKEEEERAKPDFDPNCHIVSRPPLGRPTLGCFAKPGHWACVTLEDAKTNHFDFVGELELTATDGYGNPLPIPDTPFDLAVCRDMALPKKQTKSLESVVFIPPGARTASTAYSFNAGQGGRHVVEFGPERLSPLMPSWQYHLVVLARTPEAYKYVEKLDSIRSDSIGPPDSLRSVTPPYYRVAMLGTDRRSALPSHANQWTSIACVLWDDAAPTALDAAQQRAMLDWLHWGGQLILSGPDTLDTLRDSFLAPYLPALSAGVRKLGPAELRELNAFSGKANGPLRPARPWSGVRLQKQPQAEFVPGSGELLAERRVGRGRVVVSAFRLSEREFIDWPGRDEVFSAMLLHHPPRRCFVGGDGEPLLQWADGVDRFDAGRITGLRFFARDAGVPFATYGADRADTPGQDAPYPFAGQSGVLTGDDAVPAPGVAAWNDFNDVAKAARKTLVNAARIEIPNRAFVIWVMAVYLIVLVPVNWMLFRGLGRVEWAWVAAPLIAIVCTGTVIRLAQLDIGFARLQTEVAVAEIQGDYPRAHVARYNALYTSLTTYYNLQSDDAGAAILPFPTRDLVLISLSAPPQTSKLTCRRGDQVTLSGFPVNSNSTGLVHSEELLDLGGGISLVKDGDRAWKLINRSKLNLHGVGLLRKTPFGAEEAWLGDVPARGTGTSVPVESPAEVPVHWNALDTADPAKPLWAAEREQSPLSASKAASGSLSLRKLLILAQDPLGLDAGEVRLIGWSTDDLPGLQIKPAAPQVRRGIVVIAHLSYGLGDPPKPDANSRNHQ
ncbi:MAG: hypothetical protein WCB27_21815 [Thermoguttaceae bacterium]